MTGALGERVAALAGARPTRIAPLGGGCIAPVYRCDFAARTPLVAKLARPGQTLECEAWMLDYLRRRSNLPVPAVIGAEADLLLLEYVESGDAPDAAAQRHLAELMAELHGVRGPWFGFERDTLIGPLAQPNPRCATWLEFFRYHRLLHRARAAHAAGRLPAALLARVEKLAGRLERWIAEPPHPSLIHGDAWSGNILVRNGRVAALIDPAIYWADPEIELAFGTLFGPFGASFFARYAELRPIRPGFSEARRELYNLYPLLVHIELFGGGYVDRIVQILTRFGV